ncbi:MAG: hypothetical protein OEZ58_16515, partial [Gammaproteobacteria bacterium]|nr:hypothetical protein [Gammaproteobacteria bacterium]
TYIENLQIKQSLKLIGQTKQAVIIDGSQQQSVIRIAPAIHVELQNLSITNGKSEEGGGVYNQGNTTIRHSNIYKNQAIEKGGAIFNGASLSSALDLQQVHIYENQVLTDDLYNIKSGGGAIYNAAPLQLFQVELHHNTSHDNGGAIYSVYSGRQKASAAQQAAEKLGLGGKTERTRWLVRPVDLESVVLKQVNMHHNVAENGGAITLHGVMSIYDSRLEHNTALLNRLSSGGAIFTHFDTRLRIENTLIAQNKSSLRGGAIRFFSTQIALLNNVSILQNQIAAFGRGAGIHITPTSNELQITNSVIAKNIRGDKQSNDCYGEITSQGYNLLSNSDECQWQAANGDMLGNAKTPIDPLIKPQAEGWLIASNSPLIDNADDKKCTAKQDSYHHSRRRDGNADGDDRCDIGAIEFQPH